MSSAQEFLTELWGEDPPGRILVWALRGKCSTYLRSPAGVAAQQGESDVYTGVGLAHADHGKHRRTPNDQVVAIPGLWADIDVNGGPDNKTGACADWDEANELANHLCAPTLLVMSGYGLQGWWLFEEPWRFKTRGEQRHAAKAAAQWQKLLREQAGGLDYTHDLARLLRLPGTLNAKNADDRRPVEVIERGPRYERDELLEIAGRAGEVNPGYSIGLPTSVSITAPELNSRVVDRLIQSSPRFKRTWWHERDDLPSMSEVDLSLASMAALAGYTDQQLAEVIGAHRLAHKDPKGGRLDYLTRTIARVRSSEPPAQSTTMPGTYLSEEWARTIREHLKSNRQHVIPLPFGALTRALDGGISPGDVVLVAGYTSHGKSILVDMIADTAAGAGKRVHLYLTEMTAYERGIRLLARTAHVPFRQLRRRDLSERDWRLIDAALLSLPYGCSIVSDWGVEDVVAHIGKNKWDLAVVDLIHGFSYNDERELSKTSSAIVRAAKASASGEHLGTAVVCAAHLNDGQMRDQRSAKRPKPGLHSIKGSSSLKQDADVVLFVWQQDDDEGRPTGDGLVWIAKARQGGLATVPVIQDVESMTFLEPGQRAA